MPSQTSRADQFWKLCVGGAMIGAVSSQTLLDFFSILMVFGIIYDYVKNSKACLDNFKWIGIEWAIASYFLVAILGFLVNAAPDAEVSFSLMKFTWVVTLFVYIYAFGRLNLSPSKVILFYSLGFLVTNFYAITGYMIRYDFISQEKIFRAVGLVNSATYHAHANAFHFVIFSALLYFNYSKLEKKLRIFAVVALFIFFLSIFLTMVRGIWLSIFISGVLMSLLLNRKLAVRFVLGTFLLFGIMYAASPQFRERLNPANSSASSEERKNLLKVNIQIFKEYPLLGIGYGENLRRNREYWDKPEWKLPQDYITSHAHNQYVNVLATTGIFGFLFFMSFTLFFLRKNWIMLKGESSKVGFRYALIFACLWAQIEFFLACLTDVTFEYAKIRALYLMVWALLIALERRTITLKEDAP